MSQLELLGWCSFFAAQIEDHERAPGCEPGRVVGDYGQELAVALAAGEVTAAQRPGADQSQRATVGDWVLAAAGGPRGLHRVDRVLDRRSALVRKAAGAATAPQLLAANVDLVFIVMGLDGDANLRRLERWAAAVWESGAAPAVLLNKADIADDAAAWLGAAVSAAPGVPVHLVSAATGAGTAVIDELLAGGRTGVLVGSSGVGKSTLVNRLLGDGRQRTAAVRAHDRRGRHCTTARELFVLAAGGCLIDGPGIRELQLWSGDDGLDAAFADIAALAAGCRFRDCRHLSEPGCAVAAAVAAGHLDAARVASYHKLARELASLAARQDGLARQEERRRWRAIHKSMRHLPPKGGAN
jgi:ribosome biogenesis GTPase